MTISQLAPAVQQDAEEVIIPLSAPVNLRDLGGISIDGGVLAPLVAIRADDLSIVTEDIAHSLYADGLRSIIDLRSTAEVSTSGRGPFGELPVSYHHVPLMTDISRTMRADQGALTHETMGRSYVDMVAGAAPQLVVALNIIAYSPGATAFHCAAGRDRTGVLAAMLLLALGTSDEDIVTDYGRTGPNMAAIMERTQTVMRPMLWRMGFDFNQLQSNSLRDHGMEISMEALLSHLRVTYGDPLTPLRDAGLSHDTIERLRARSLATQEAASA